MSQDNSMYVDQREMASEYGRYVEAKNKKGFLRFVIKALVLPIFALALILAVATFLVANNSPDTYTQAKDIFFANVNIEQLTGMPASVVQEHLDNLLILNSEKQEGVAVISEGLVQREPVPDK